MSRGNVQRFHCLHHSTYFCHWRYYYDCFNGNIELSVWGCIKLVRLSSPILLLFFATWSSIWNFSLNSFMGITSSIIFNVAASNFWVFAARFQLRRLGPIKVFVFSRMVYDGCYECKQHTESTSAINFRYSINTRNCDETIVQSELLRRKNQSGNLTRWNRSYTCK